MPADLAVNLRPPVAPRRALPPLGGDERLARQVAAGDERAFARLYERYHQPLYRYSRSMTHNDADAQDALQSALTNAFIALREGRRDAPVRPWLYRIVHNEAVSLMRRRRGELELSEAAALTGVSTEERAEERARLSALVADLQELPERQRGALLMHELSGLGHEEIASAFGVSNGVVRQLVYEARRSLQEFAEGRALACDDVCRVISDGDGRGLRSRRIRAHLRDCSGCSAFAQAIPARQADLRAIVPPLPAAAAAGLLTRLLGGGSGHAGGGTSAAAIGSSAAGKTAVIALSTKAVTGIAIVAATSVGIGSAVEHFTSSPPSSHPAQIAPAGHGSATGSSSGRGAGGAAPPPRGGGGGGGPPGSDHHARRASESDRRRASAQHQLNRARRHRRRRERNGDGAPGHRRRECRPRWRFGRRAGADPQQHSPVRPGRVQRQPGRNQRTRIELPGGHSRQRQRQRRRQRQGQRQRQRRERHGQDDRGRQVLRFRQRNLHGCRGQRPRQRECRRQRQRECRRQRQGQRERRRQRQRPVQRRQHDIHLWQQRQGEGQRQREGDPPHLPPARRRPQHLVAVLEDGPLARPEIFLR